MTCACKCCCGCCCDGETGSQTLETPCTSPKVFHGKGTICDVCCDLGEILEDIDSEEDCPGTWVTNGRCLETPCEPPCSGSCDEENPCPEGCACVDGECVELGVCCVCTDGFNGLIMDACFATEEEMDAYVADLENVRDYYVGEMESKGYVCISPGGAIDPGRLDESNPDSPNQWCTNGFVPPPSGTCCGVVDPDERFNPFILVPTCIQDDVTRDCWIGETTRASCEACEGQTFHAGQTCADEPCNPAP
jgi:hypothetical protein